MPFSIRQANIATVSADVIVNAANEHLLEGGGVCEAIFAGAGPRSMRQACSAIGYCSTGHVVTTPGFDLPCRWVVHAVGPVWRGGGNGEEALLRSCYRSVFAEVSRLGAHSVALPLISAGIYGYPVDQAARVAREEAAAFLERADDVDVMLVVLDRSQLKTAVDRSGALRRLVDETLAPRTEPLLVPPPSCAGEKDGRVRTFSGFCTHCGSRLPDGVRFCTNCGAPVAETEMFSAPMASAPCPAPPASKSRGLLGRLSDLPRGSARRFDGLNDALRNLDASFSATLLALIDERGLTDAQVYKRANISRQLFSKIRSNRDYRPTKPTAVALGLALRLSMDELQQLLARAGLTLSHSSAFDVIVEFFVQGGEYDIFLINEALFAYDQPLLGSS